MSLVECPFYQATYATPPLHLNSLAQTTPRGFHVVAIRLAEKSLVKAIKPELGASSLFGDVASRVKEAPVEQGGKAKAKEVIG